MLFFNFVTRIDPPNLQINPFIFTIKENAAMRIKTFLIIALLLTSAAAWAQNFNFANLTAEEVKQRIEQSEKMLIVDARTEEEYKQGHIPTAVNIPPPQYISIDKHLPQDKVLPIIFYCRGYS
jgi:predicted sulfurtransferase